MIAERYSTYTHSQTHTQLIKKMKENQFDLTTYT